MFPFPNVTALLASWQIWIWSYFLCKFPSLVQLRSQICVFTFSVNSHLSPMAYQHDFATQLKAKSWSVMFPSPDNECSPDWQFRRKPLGSQWLHSPGLASLESQLNYIVKRWIFWMFEIGRSLLNNTHGDIVDGKNMQRAHDIFWRYVSTNVYWCYLMTSGSKY